MAASGVDRGADLCAMGVAELGRLYRARELSPVEVVQAVVERIERYNPELNAFITVLADSALESARAAEAQIRAGIDLGPLHGVPVSVKDIINVRGTRTTAASRVLLDAPLDEADAPVVRRLRGAGAILVGKVNLHEFAFGDPDPEGPFGRVQNPRKVGHQSGSSSSGSAASVAAGLGVISIGTDTGGSIRNPSGVCGVVGLKPTYGLVPLRGVIPLASRLDHVGPLARSIEDAAAALSVRAGHDPLDPYSAKVPVDDYAGAAGRGIEHLRVGVPTNPFYQVGSAEMRSLRENVRRLLADIGLISVPLELPRAEETNDLGMLLLTTDLWVYHERHQERAALYGRHFAQRAASGRRTTGIEYAKAKAAQTEIRRLWLDLFEKVDLLILPSNLVGAPPHGVDEVEVDGERCPVRMGISRFNRVSNLTGFPSLALPIGLNSADMPIGAQLVGPPFSEARLIAVGHQLERALGNLTRRWGIEPRGTQEGL